MNFHGHVADFNSSNRSYLINFKVISEDLNIPSGKADVELRIGDTKVKIHNQNELPLNDEVHTFLRNKFLETIYSYNKERIHTLCVEN